MTNTKLTARNQAERFVAECKKAGWNFAIDLMSGDSAIVTITKRFTPGDQKAYTECDGEAFHLLAMIPLRGGSVWGTDGGSVGGYVGCKNGEYRLNKSGMGKRIVAALADFRNP